MDDWNEVETDAESPRRYWAQRHGERGARIDLAAACALFRSVVTALVAEDYLQEWAGYHCVDAGDVHGTGGDDPGAFAFRKTRLEGLWPPGPLWDNWDESHLMTAVEFFHDVVSKPVAGRYHDYMDCGYHATRFNRRDGRLRYQAEVNPILADLVDGFELEASGIIVRVIPTGLDDLVDESLPATAGNDAEDTLAHAIGVFRARGSSERDQLDAIRSLSALLESLRPLLKTAFNHKDEADLFEVANRFNVRHANAKQQGTYDRSIFLPWIFYSHVAAIHAAYRLIERLNPSQT